MSQPGIFNRIRGWIDGTISAKAMPPALPKEQPSPGGNLSMIVTRKPARCKNAALETPTMPAPMTVAWGCDMGIRVSWDESA
jgi:hypothetical protein